MIKVTSEYSEYMTSQNTDLEVPKNKRIKWNHRVTE